MSSSAAKEEPPEPGERSNLMSAGTSAHPEEVFSIPEVGQIEPDEQSLTTQCGIGKYRPECLQRFADKSWMLFWMCWFCLVQGMLVNGLVPSVLSTIERRFDFTTSMLGRIMQCYDIGYVICCIPVSYFGGRHSKPLFIGLGLFILTCGSMVFSMPHIVSEAYTSSTDSTSSGHCSSESPSSLTTSGLVRNLSLECNPMQSSTQVSDRNWYLAVFCLAHLLHGVGATPLFTIGVSYIDENVKAALSSMYLGVFYAFAIFGPAIGFLLSGTFLRFHTDFLQPEQERHITAIDESDQSWIGAWWLGFLIAAILGVIGVFPIASFPKVLPKAVRLHRTRAASQRSDTPATQDEKIVEELEPEVESEGKAASLWQRLWADIQHIPKALARLFTNSAFMLITLAAACMGLLITGMSTFMAKYLERQFNVSASRSNVLIGCIMVPMAGFGTMLSGFVVKQLRLTCANTLKYSIAMVVSSLILSPMFLIYCQHNRFVGIEAPYPVTSHQSSNSTEFTLFSQCNSHCTCSTFEFHPVCAEMDGQSVPFFSPCYAGCSDPFTPSQKFYSNCTCAPVALSVTKGLCQSKCRGLVGFLILFAPMVFCTFSVGVPLLSVVLRTVDYDERSFALGIQWILLRCIGTIPAPVLFGWLFDISCLGQHTDPCLGAVGSGSCYLYHNKLLADLFLAFAVICQTVTLVWLVLALVFYRRAHSDPIEEVDNEQL